MASSVNLVNSNPLTSPSVPLFEQNAETLSDTDKKVNCLIVLRGFLVAGASFIGISGLVLSIVINPVFLVAAIPSVALAILGVRTFFPNFLENGIYYRNTDNLPIEFPGQPLGLRNASCNCWVNSALHFILDIKAFAPLLQRLRETSNLGDGMKCTELLECILKYESSTTRVSCANTQKIREWLCDSGVPIRRSAFSQEDAIVFFDYLLPQNGVHLPIVQACSPKEKNLELSETPFKATNEFLHVDLEIDLEQYQIDFNKFNHPQIPFEELFKNFFNSSNESNLSITKRFSHEPEDFLLLIKRFGRNSQGKQGKIHSSIDVPLQINLKDQLLHSKADILYECDGIILHSGTLNGGHYVAYVKKMGLWWECNDRRIRPISEDELLNLREAPLSKGYIYHFSKVDLV